MRRKREAVLAFESNDDGLPKVVRDYRARYRAISQVLDENPTILDLVHKDLKQLSKGSGDGREGDYTSENILRALIVQNLDGLPFGHKVLLCQTPEKFISDYEVYEKQPDCELTESVVQRHEKLFGTKPEALAADKGFCPAQEKFLQLAEQVDTLAIPQRCRTSSTKCWLIGRPSGPESKGPFRG